MLCHVSTDEPSSRGPVPLNNREIAKNALGEAILGGPGQTGCTLFESCDVSALGGFWWGPFHDDGASFV